MKSIAESRNDLAMSGMYPRPDLARVTSEGVGPGGSPTAHVSLPATCHRPRVKVTTPVGSGSVYEPEDADVIVVEERLAGPRFDVADGDAAGAALMTALIDDPRFPHITTNASAKRAIDCIAAEVMELIEIDDQNNITFNGKGEP